MNEADEGKRVSAQWLTAKLNSIDDKLDRLLNMKKPIAARGPVKQQDKPRPKERVIYDSTSDSYYAVPIVEDLPQ